jgi:DNA-binding Lrp family transcriptional regulator
MSLFSYIIHGELTGKHKQALQTIDDILRAFYNEKHEKEPRKWNDLMKITGLSNAVLSKHLRELIRQGVVKGEVRVPENKMEIFYEYTGKAYIVEGQEPKLKEVTRIWFDKMGKEGAVKVEQGFLKKGKGGSRYFVEEK